MTDFLVLGGPGHLQVVALEDNRDVFEMADVTPDRNPVQTFRYKVVRVGAGSHPPIGFLVPAHLEGDAKHISAWVFNKLVQSLMGGDHPMAGHAVLGLNFVLAGSVLQAQVRAHPVGVNGFVRLAPLDVKESCLMVEPELLRSLKDPRGFLETKVRMAAEEAFRPFIDRAVNHVLNRGDWPTKKEGDA